MNFYSIGLLILDFSLTWFSHSLDSVWAAGEMVLFPMLTYERELVNISRWDPSIYLGRVAALNMMGHKVIAAIVP